MNEREMPRPSSRLSGFGNQASSTQPARFFKKVRFAKSLFLENGVFEGLCGAKTEQRFFALILISLPV